MQIKLNPDTTLVNEIRQKVKDNAGYCPCKLIKDENAKCMCKEFRDQARNNIPGFCHCGLYVVEDTQK